MTKYKVRDGKIETEPTEVPLEAIRAEREAAQSALNTAQEARVEFLEQSDATITHHAELIRHLDEIIGAMT